MVDIEEGVLSHWHFGRSALVGDAAHKVSRPEFNAGVIADVPNKSHLTLPSAVTLVWEVWQLLRIC